MAEILLFAACILCVSLKKSYHYLAALPASRETGGSPKYLRDTLKHPGFLNIFFETVLLGVFALFALYAAFDYGANLAFLIIFIGLSVVFILLPRVAVSRAEIKLARLLAKPLAYCLNKAGKPIGKVERFIEKTDQKLSQPEPLSKSAISKLLNEQEHIADPQAKDDLRLAGRALELSSLKISYVMVRKHKARFVDTQEQVGPVLLSELHKTGRKIFPARDKEADIAGIVRLDALAELKAGGKPADVLNPQMVVIGKDDTAPAAIKRFIESAAELLFVEDEKGEVTGIVYLEDILKKLSED